MTIHPSQHTPAYPPADLSTCDREPIHVPGAIQPHGVLLAVDSDRHDIVMASANTSTELDLPARSLIGAPLSTAIGTGPAKRVAAAIALGTLGEPLRVTLHDVAGDLQDADVDLVVHRSGHRYVVEIEPAETTGMGASSYRTARAALNRLEATADVMGLSQVLANEIRDLTHFDRVMIYRFDEQWNGEVVAEARRDDLNPFLGLHYPSTDIPAQARRLYTVNWIRLIADIGYQPVPLHPVLDPDTEQALDLSFSMLRSVSPLHVEYLSNMGVTASMSVSLLQDGELWGLIACHHYSGAHRPPYDARASAEFVAQVASGMIADRERLDDRIQQMSAQRMLARLMNDLVSDTAAPHDALIHHPQVLELFGATGAAIFAEGRMLTVGSVPPASVVHRISAALDPGRGGPASTDHLAGLDGRLEEHADVAAGALRIATTPDRWMMWLRPAQDRTVDWGGDPLNAKLYDTEGPEVRLSPRKSFDLWRETIHHHSAPWEDWTLDVAEQLRTSVSGLLLQRSREQIVLAESVQREVLLPESPVVPGFDVSVHYRPAADNRLGGDWCDAFKLPHGRAAFVVGDVAGHGLAAATAMTQVRTAVRAYLVDGHSPGSCLDRLDHLVASTMDGLTLSVTVVVLSTDDGTGSIASAGHPAPVLRDAVGARLVDLSPRPLIGIGVEDRSEHDLDLGTSTMVLYTDGLVEQREVPFTKSQGVLVAKVEATEPRDDLLDWSRDVWASLTARRSELDDDRTMLVVRRRR